MRVSRGRRSGRIRSRRRDERKEYMLIRIEIPMSCQTRHYVTMIQATNRSTIQLLSPLTLQSPINHKSSITEKDNKIGIIACIFQHNLLLTRLLRLEASRGFLSVGKRYSSTHPLSNFPTERHARPFPIMPSDSTTPIIERNPQTPTLPNLMLLF